MNSTEILHMLKDKFTVIEVRSTVSLHKPFVTVRGLTSNNRVMEAGGLDIDSAFQKLLADYVNRSVM